MSESGAEHKPALAALFLPYLLSILTLIICLQFASCVHEGRECEIAGDFPVFYKAAQQAAGGDVSSLYDTSLLTATPQGPHPVLSFHPYLNPPLALVLFVPLGFFSYPVALFLWYGAQVLLTLLILRTHYARAVLGERTDALLLLFPFAALTVLSGQTGLLTADLFILTLMLRAPHPVISGLVLACMSFKPQLGIVLPLLLVKEKNWPALMAMLLGTLSLIGLSVALWGEEPWRQYDDMLELYQRLLSFAPQHYVELSANPYMGMSMLGVGPRVAWDLQLILSLGMLAALWNALGHDMKEPQKIFLLTVSAFLISPYSFLYDTVPVAFACAVLITRWKAGEISPPEHLALVLLAFIPIVGLQMQAMGMPYGSLSLLMVSIVALRMPAKPPGLTR